MGDKQHTKRILILSNRIRRVFERSTGHKWTKVRILYYLLNAGSDKPVFQKDIQQDLEIRAAAVSALLKQLEKEGLIIRADVQWDNRLKEIWLTQETFQMKEKICGQMESLEQELTEGIEPRELEICLDVIEKMTKNMEKAEKDTGKQSEKQK